MTAIEDFARSRRPATKATATSAVWRGKVTEVHSNGMVYVLIPRYASADPVGPIPSAVAGLQIGDQVVVAAVSGRASEMLVVSTADGSSNWFQLPDLSVVPEDGADMDLFNSKGTALVSDDVASSGLHFPAPVGGLAEAWSRGSGEMIQRYTAFDGRVFVRSRTYPDPWPADWESSIIAPEDIAGATALGIGLLSAGTSSAARLLLALGNVDNTSDMAKPVSNPTLAALALKAPLESPHFTGTPTGISKIHVGLDLVDNTSDAKKPASESVLALLATKESYFGTGASTDYLRGDRVFAPLDKTAVGLGNVDNTSDLAKAVSTATTAALALKSDTGHTHAASAVVSGVFDPALLPAVTTSVQGAMTAADKTKLNASTSTVTNSALVQRSSGGFFEVATPTSATHAANKSYVDAQDLLDAGGLLGFGGAGTTQSIDTTELLMGECTQSLVAGRNYKVTFIARQAWPSGAGVPTAATITFRTGGSGTSGTSQQTSAWWVDMNASLAIPDGRVMVFHYIATSTASTRISITAVKAAGTGVTFNIQNRVLLVEDMGSHV